MCIFTQPVEEVKNTKIFARVEGNTQNLVYSMTYGANTDLAMVLPLPVANRVEDAVEFINLENYKDFFKDMEQAFVIQTRGLSFGADSYGVKSLLKVEEVGDYIASFVPTAADFKRLDPQFRLDSQALDLLPQYQNFGFAVFQLKATKERKLTNFWDLTQSIENMKGLSKSVQPMAFRFKTAQPELIFFPTVHIHDGKVHPVEHFDHTLYFQADKEVYGKMSKNGIGYLNLSDYYADVFIKPKHQNLIEDKNKIAKLTIKGEYPNRDIIIPL